MATAGGVPYQGVALSVKGPTEEEFRLGNLKNQGTVPTPAGQEPAYKRIG